jgi:hypothetical protein
VLAGTRITLYSLMDYLKVGWPAQLIRDRLNLTDQQIHDAIDYIDAHRDEVEAEYALVLRQAEENRGYWQQRNKERFAEQAARAPSADKRAAWEKLQAKKHQLGLS